MAYKALYNKYRPQTFEDVVGQQGIVRTLQNAIKSDKIAHAYLFSGPRGTGKTTMARLFAKALNCEHGLGEQCNECLNCRAITEGSHPDVVEIDAASNNGVDQVRDLIEKVRYAPIKGRYKVYIIDEVHMMSQGAFNALLKTLEEPPEQVIFILATTEPYKILPTILSRCQRFDFGKIEDLDLKNRLFHVLDEEKVEFEEKAVDQIVALSDGGMRDALSILEQVLAYSGTRLEEADVLTLFGLASNAQKIDLLKLVKGSDVSGVLQKLDEFLAGGIDIKRLNGSLLDILKDLLIYEKTGDPWLISSINEDEAEELAGSIDPGSASKMISVLLKAQNDFRNVSNIRSLFELTLLQLCSIEDTPVIAPKVIEQPAPAPKAKVAPKAEDVPTFAPKAEPIKEEAPAFDVSSIKEAEIVAEGDSNTLDEDSIIGIMVLGKNNREERRELTLKWKTIQELKAHPAVGNIATLLSDGHPFCLSEDVLLITYDFTRLKNKANIKSNQPAIAAMVEQLLGRHVFVYALDRLDCNKYLTRFSNLDQLNKLPNKDQIQIKLPEGD